MFREVSIIIKKDFRNPELVDLQIGKPGEVEFDTIKAHLYLKKNKLKTSDLLFIHVHPPGYGNEPSGQDYICLKNMFLTFGRYEKIYFGIVDFSKRKKPLKEFVKIYSYTGNDVVFKSDINILTFGILYNMVDKFLPTLEYLSENLLLIEEK